MSAYRLGAIKGAIEKGLIFLSGHLDDSEKQLKPPAELADLNQIEKFPGILIRSGREWQNPSHPVVGYADFFLKGHFSMRHEIEDAINSFREAIKKIKGVVRIAYSFSDESVIIWTFLKKFNRKSLYQIYEIEKNVTEKYRSITFDFSTFFSPTRSIPSDFKQEELA